MKFRTSKNSKPIPVLLDQSLRERIASASGKMGEPQSTVMRISMRIGLEQLEKLFAEKTPGEIISSIRTDAAAPAGSGPGVAWNDESGPAAPPPPTAPPTEPVQYRKPRRTREK
jgi:hypothetical protein